MKKFFLLFLLILPVIASSQLDITVTSKLVPLYTADGDTLSGCRDSLIWFKAEVTDGGNPVTGAEYYWDFDDGYSLQGTDRDSVEHQYENGGGYRVKLKVVDAGSQTGFKILPVKIAPQPNYSKTKVDLPEDVNGICKGSSANLIGKAYTEKWKDTVIYEVKEESAKEINDVLPYSSSIFFDEFPEGQTFNAGDIDSIGISLEHSDSGNLEIKLTCENGTSVILKNYDNTNHAYLGEPVDDEASSEVGTPYTYYWSNSSTSGIINAATLSPIPEAAYLPEESLDNFAGCPMNGNWTIDISDNQNTDNGFVFSWIIVFKESVKPAVWTFRDTLVPYKTVDGTIIGSTYWEGKNTGGTFPYVSGDTITGNTTASPDVYGPNGYKFHVINNFGCPQDTQIILTAEEASATATPQNGEAELDVKFKNTTSWATEKEWDFGDRSLTELITDEDTVSHTYIEKGTYKAILKVSDDKGCFDYDTITVEVSVEPSKLENIPNVFTPNDDGINDVWKFSEESLKGMEKFHITIYNRWGKKVWETYDQDEAINTGWDGKNSLGITCSPGVYYYVIKAEGKDGIIYEGDRGGTDDTQTTSTEENKITAGCKGTIRLFR
ncbi:MAG: PKD domain-containing protein [Chlorobi bacterium]|nr:PKD domain-containing protein [Chlorobiota bacterium]